MDVGALCGGGGCFCARFVALRFVVRLDFVVGCLIVLV